MREWNEAIQRMLDWLEDNITESPTLLDMSRQIGYSPCYCSTQFHRVTGLTIKRYVASRRLAIATLALRDTKESILDIAVRVGYSSQEALTRAFVTAYGVTPYVYRRNWRPLKLPMKKNVLFPENDLREDTMMMQNGMLTEARARVEYVPAHAYIGIWDDTVSDYMSFWDKHDCDAVCGTVESMRNEEDPVIVGHTAGWYDLPGGGRGYFYGLGVPVDYAGAIPEGFEKRNVAAGYYMVFYHPPFDFQKDCAEVMNRVETLAWEYDPSEDGFAWDAGRPYYQRHMPEVVGYEVLRPVKKAK